MIGGFENAAGKQLFQSLWKRSAEVFGKSQKQSQFFSAIPKYYTYYQARHGITKVLGMPKPTDVALIYTTVRVLKSNGIKQFESLEGLEEQYRAQGKQSLSPQQKNQEKSKGIDIAREKQYLMVLGQPGAGKSTFLKKMGLEALQGKCWKFTVRTNEGEKVEERACIPVLLELKHFNVKQRIETAITKELANCGFLEFEKPVQKWLEKGNLLLLFDGLDEVPSDSRDQLATAIQDFVDRYPHNRYITSCRTAAYHSRFRRFTDVTVTNFDDKQIKEFIHNWFHTQDEKQTQTADRFWGLLQKPEQNLVKELAQSPLLLTFLCLVYQRSQTIPPNRSSLYEKALNILLEEWAIEKQVKRDEIYQGLHSDLELELLAEIAYHNFKKDHLFFYREDILRTIREFLVEQLDAPKHLNARKVLHAIEEQQGILVEQNEGIYSFSHPTLQEYLTAKYITTNHLVEEMVDQHLTDDRWSEVFLLVADLMRDQVIQLFKKMAKRAQEYLDTHRLQELIKWADLATTDSIGNYKPIAKRASAISLILSLPFSLYFPISQSIDLELLLNFCLCHSLARKFDINFSRNLYFSISQSLSFYHQLKKIDIFNTIDLLTLIKKLEKIKAEEKVNFKMVEEIFNVIGLDSNVANLSKEEIKALENYLRANLIIVQYKESTITLSEQSWQLIENNLLRLN